MRVIKRILLILISVSAVDIYAAGSLTGEQIVEDVQNSLPPRMDSSKRASEQLQNFKNNKKINNSFDGENVTIVSLKFVAAKITSTDPDFMSIRESLVVEAMLNAKAEIIETINTKASASNILSMPGNPIAKQLELENNQYKKYKEDAKNQLEKAQKEAIQLMSAVDQAHTDELAGATWNDRLQRLLDATIKKLDENYSQQEISDQKKEKLVRLKARYEKALAAEDKAQTKMAEIEEKFKNIQDQVKKEQRSTVETISEMPLIGATIIAQAESFDDLYDDYEIAILVVWSQKLEKQARSVLLMEGELVPRPKGKSINEYLNDQNLALMIGPRRFLAADGSINFMGVSSVEFDPDDPGAVSSLIEEANLWAKQAALLSAIGDVSSFKSAEKLRQQVVGADGKSRERIFKDMSTEIKNSVEGFQVRGMEILRTERTVHPATGRNIIVAVANLNSTLAVKSADIMKDTYATLKEVNAKQSYMKGEVEGMKASAAETKNNQVIEKQGYDDGKSKVSQEFDTREDKREAKKASEEPPQEITRPKAIESKAQSGTWTSFDDIDDDF